MFRRNFVLPQSIQQFSPFGPQTIHIVSWSFHPHLIIRRKKNQSVSRGDLDLHFRSWVACVYVSHIECLPVNRVYFNEQKCGLLYLSQAYRIREDRLFVTVRTGFVCFFFLSPHHRFETWNAWGFGEVLAGVGLNLEHNSTEPCKSMYASYQKQWQMGAPKHTSYYIHTCGTRIFALRYIFSFQHSFVFANLYGCWFPIYDGILFDAIVRSFVVSRYAHVCDIYGNKSETFPSY